MCVKAEGNSLRQYVKYHIEPLIVGVRISNTVPSENFTQPKECKRQDNEERLNDWKAMHGQYLGQIESKDKSTTLKWLMKINLKRSTEALIFSVQEEALRTNYVKFQIDKTAESPRYRTYRVEKEIVSHIGMNSRCRPKRNIKRGMPMNAGIFIGDYLKELTVLRA